MTIYLNDDIWLINTSNDHIRSTLATREALSSLATGALLVPRHQQTSEIDRFSLGDSHFCLKLLTLLSLPYESRRIKKWARLVGPGRADVGGGDTKTDVVSSPVGLRGQDRDSGSRNKHR